jgi:hypothetical protein
MSTVMKQPTNIRNEKRSIPTTTAEAFYTQTKPLLTSYQKTPRYALKLLVRTRLDATSSPPHTNHLALSDYATLETRQPLKTARIPKRLDQAASSQKPQDGMPKRSETSFL